MNKILFLTETQEDKITLFEQILTAFNVKYPYTNIGDYWCTIKTFAGDELSIKETFSPYSEQTDRGDGWSKVMFDRKGDYSTRHDWQDYTDLGRENMLEGDLTEMLRYAVEFLENCGYKVQEELV